jgi:hypothetical protein
MTQRNISVEISKLLRESNKQGVLLEVFCDIDKMWEQSDPEYDPKEDWDYDEGIDILNR